MKYEKEIKKGYEGEIKMNKKIIMVVASLLFVTGIIFSIVSCKDEIAKSELQLIMEKGPEEVLSKDEVMLVSSEASRLSKECEDPLIKKQIELYASYDRGEITKEEIQKELLLIKEASKKCDELVKPYNEKIKP